MKQLIKRALLSVLPETTTAILSARSRSHSHRLVKEWGLDEVNRLIVQRFGSCVQHGPFRGMSLSPLTHAEHLGPFLLGTYEAELHPWLERILGSRFSQVLDVGAKFGYYAIGFARRMSATPVIAFDTDHWARTAMREMAGLNRTPNVSPVGYCSSSWLDRNLLPGSFILSDCEGFEAELFSRSTTPSLDSATLLIEIHDNLIPGVGDTIRHRFRLTHEFSVVSSGTRKMPALDLGFLTPEQAASATREIRDPQDWFLLAPIDG